MLRIRHTLRKMTESYGFVAKGNTLFRVHGDGVLQSLKWHKEQIGNATYVLRIGLQSMYGELSPQIFSSNGSVQQYAMVNIIGERIVPNWSRSAVEYTDVQLKILKSEGLVWLDSIKTQQQLSQAFLMLDGVEGEITWNDENKLAPYLASGDLENAKKVISSILYQHKVADYYNKNQMSYSQRQKYLQLRNGEDSRLEKLLQMINSEDIISIQQYLIANHMQNRRYV